VRVIRLSVSRSNPLVIVCERPQDNLQSAQETLEEEIEKKMSRE
jgi:hypothetical protein